jgi:cysteine desulfurase
MRLPSMHLMVYLDHNATTPLAPEALEAMLPYLRERFGNPSSAHRAGRDARDAIERARAQVATLVHARPEEIVFTSGGTEANNLALKGIAAVYPKGGIAVSAIEHASVLAPARALAQQGRRVREIAVDREGRVTAESLGDALGGDTRVVSVMAANNETGVIQDIAALAGAARAAGAIMHCDAVQAAGKIALDFAASGVQLMTLSAHKLNGPKGVGALVVDRRLDIEAQLHGGGHEGGRRAGTENIAGIVGFGAAAERCAQGITERSARLEALRTRLETRLRALPGIEIHGAGAHRIPNTVFFSVSGVDGATLLMLLDEDGFALSSGSACGSDDPEPSHVLLAMGVAPERARGALRVSLGDGNRPEEIDAFVDKLGYRIETLLSLVRRVIG